MNAPSNLTRALTAANQHTRNTEQRARAKDILAGFIPLADYPVFTRQQWMDEAQAAIDTGDDAELREMIERQDAKDAAEHSKAMRAYYGVDPRRRNWMEVE